MSSMRRLSLQTVPGARRTVAWLVIAAEDTDSQIFQKGSRHFSGSFHRDTPSQITIKGGAKGANHIRILPPARRTLRAPGAIRESLDNPELSREIREIRQIRQSGHPSPLRHPRDTKCKHNCRTQKRKVEISSHDLKTCIQDFTTP